MVPKTSFPNCGEDTTIDGSYEAKGIGEIISIPTMPAITNAINNAVGIGIDKLPNDQETILIALKLRSR